jgi:hypothetical protein
MELSELSPSNEEFVKQVETTFERFPSVTGSIFNAALQIKWMYEEKGVNMDKQYIYFLTKH